MSHAFAIRSRWLVGLVTLCFSLSALAAGVVEDIKGTARIAGKAANLIKGTQVDTGDLLTTGQGSHVTVRFDDGQVIVLNENTEFRVDNYRFDKADAEKSNALFSLLKGGLRAISGLIAQRNHKAFALTTPVATIGIRGTDFMAVTGSLYLSISQGMVSASSTAGSMSFAAGQIGFVAGPAIAPISIALSQLPASVAASFSQLGAIPVTGAGAAGGAGSAAGPGGAAPGVGTGVGTGTTIGAGTVGAIGAGVAAAAAAASSKTTTTSAHH